MNRIILLLAGLTLALVLLGVLVASSSPDGLESVAESLGFAGRASEGEAWSPFADYEFRHISSSWPAQVTAGLAGVALMYGFGVLLGRFVRRGRRS
jgi:cobalt/nickel transport system permease protein/cobalt/nickel transport protein